MSKLRMEVKDVLGGGNSISSDSRKHQRKYEREFGVAPLWNEWDTSKRGDWTGSSDHDNFL